MSVVTIARFAGQWAFLSNFYPSRISLGEYVYATVEHAFQSHKTMLARERRDILNASTPSEAKRLGRRVTLRPDWETVKIEVMRACLRIKFSDPALRASLLATGDATLEEGNTWGDRFWGTVDGVGENWLGRLLMEVRAECAWARPRGADGEPVALEDGLAIVSVAHVGKIRQAASDAVAIRRAVAMLKAGDEGGAEGALEEELRRIESAAKEDT